MRILHTSDWHLGRNFGQVSLAADQAAFAAWLLDVVRSERIDLVVVAGDLFDRSIPPLEAVNLLGDTLRALAEQGVRVAAIAGNHDSADRVAAADGLTDAAGVLIRGGFERAGLTTTMQFADGPLDIVAVPYLDPVLAPRSALWRPEPPAPTVAAPPAAPVPAARPAPAPDRRQPVEGQLALDFGDDTGDVAIEAGADFVAPVDLTIDVPARAPRLSHQAVLKRALDRRTRQAPRSIAIAHAFVAGGTETESERALSVGDSPRIATTTFDDFDYVALGHLHRPQLAGGPTRRYSGSPLPYSFSESHPKSVIIVDLDPTGAATVTELPIPIGRPVATVTGSIDELLNEPRHQVHESHFVRAVLTDSSHVLDAKARLLKRFGYVTEVVVRPAPSESPASGAVAAGRVQLDPVTAATSFWSDVTGREPTIDELALLTELLNQARATETTSGALA